MKFLILFMMHVADLMASILKVMKTENGSHIGDITELLQIYQKKILECRLTPWMPSWLASKHFKSKIEQEYWLHCYSTGLRKLVNFITYRIYGSVKVLLPIGVFLVKAPLGIKVDIFTLTATTAKNAGKNILKQTRERFDVFCGILLQIRVQNCWLIFDYC